MSYQSEPLHETAHRLVIRVHLQQGNVAEAIGRFREYKRTLATELGAAPSAAMCRLISPCFSRDTSAIVLATTATIVNATSATQLRLSAIVNRCVGGRWNQLNAAALASEVSNPSPRPQYAAITRTAGR